MKIGLIAMSGVRAANEELTKIGLTLPGFVERSKIIASLPSLSLLTLAGMTPPDIEVEYREVPDLRQAVDLPQDYDLAAISTYSAQVFEAYELARRYRDRGVPVVMGGLHVSVLPKEAVQHCTTVAIGEGENVWPQIIDDFRHGRLKRQYGQTPDTTRRRPMPPMPRFELLDPARYNRITVQTSRGCPHRCEFCASSVLLTPHYYVKPIDRVIAEIHRIKEIWDNPFLEFADDNSFVSRNYYMRLLHALKNENVKWFTEADVSIAEDPPLLDAMRESGCRQVLIGLESPDKASLDGLELRTNWKLRRQPRYEQAIQAIQSRGITVNGCFILGLDGDTEDVFDSVYQFIDRTGLYEAQITVLTPFPGTPLYDRLRQEGRIIDEGAWNKCTLFDVNFVPRGMSPERLQWGMVELARRVYDRPFIRDRRQRFFAQLRKNRIKAYAIPEEESTDEDRLD